MTDGGKLDLRCRLSVSDCQRKIVSTKYFNGKLVSLLTRQQCGIGLHLATLPYSALLYVRTRIESLILIDIVK